MTTAAVMMVRDERDIIGGAVCHALSQVDAVYVLDHGSTDGTREILDALAVDLEVRVFTDWDRAYYQSQKMTALAEHAAADGFGFIVPIDADELWGCGDLPLRDVLPTLDCPVLAATLYDHVSTGVDPLERDPFRRMVWRRRAQGGLPKVAFRWEDGAVIAQGNHSVELPSYPDGAPTATGAIVHHFPVRSPEQFRTKVANGAAAYTAAADLPRDMGIHWRVWGEILDRHGEAGLQEVFDRHYAALSPLDAGLVYDPAPYQAGRWS